MDIERKEISRKQLYDEIWELSLAGVARKYNLNYSRFRSLCKDEDIPVPSSGYWTRKNMGKDVSGEKPELTGPPDKVLFLSLNKEIKKPDEKEMLPEEPTAASDETATERSVVIWDESRLDFLDKEERDKVLASASELRINNSSRLNRTLTMISHLSGSIGHRERLTGMILQFRWKMNILGNAIMESAAKKKTKFYKLKPIGAGGGNHYSHRRTSSSIKWFFDDNI